MYSSNVAEISHIYDRIRQVFDDQTDDDDWMMNQSRVVTLHQCETSLETLGFSRLLHAVDDVDEQEPHSHRYVVMRAFVGILLCPGSHCDLSRS